MQITSIFWEKNDCADLGIIITFLNSTDLEKKNQCKQETVLGTHMSPMIKSILSLKSALRITLQKVLRQEWRAKQVKSHSYWPPAIRTSLDTFMWSALWTETIL